MQADLGRFVGSSCHLVGGAGYLLGRIATVAHQLPQAFDHAHEGFAQGVIFRPRLDVNAEIAPGDSL